MVARFRLLILSTLLCLVACPAPRPQNAVQATLLQLPWGKPYAVQVEGDRAYVAHGQAGLVTVDLAQARVLSRFVTGFPGPGSLGREWVHEWAGEATAVSVAGKFAYLLLQRKGYDVQRTHLLRLDLSQVQEPRESARFLLQGTATAVLAQSPTRVWVLRQLGGTYPPNSQGVVTLLDFEDPQRVRQLGSLAAPEKGFQGQTLRWESGRLLLSDSQGRTFASDWSQMDQPRWLGLQDPPPAAKAAAYQVDLDSQGLVVKGPGQKTRTVATAGGPFRFRHQQGENLVCGQGLQVYQGLQLKHTWLAGERVHDALRTSPQNYLAATSSGLWQLTPEGAPERKGGACRRLASGGGLVVGADSESLFVLGGASLKLPGIEAIAINPQGTVAAVAQGRRGIKLVDLKQLRVLASYFDEACGRMSVLDIVMRDNTLYAADADNGLHILEISQPDKLKRLRFVPCPNALSLTWHASKIVVANGMFPTTAVQDRPPWKAQSHPTGANFQMSVDAQGQLLGLGQGQLAPLALGPGQELANWQLEKTVPVPMGIPRRICLAGDGRKAWIANDEGWNLVEIDLQDLSSPKAGPIRATGGFARAVAWSNKALAATNHRTLQVFEGFARTPSWVLLLPKPGNLMWVGQQLWVECASEHLQGWDLTSAPKGLGRLPISRGLCTWNDDGRDYLAGATNTSVKVFQGTQLQGEIPLDHVVATASAGEKLYLATPGQIRRASARPPFALDSVPLDTEGSILAMAADSNWIVTAGSQLTVVDARQFKVSASLKARPSAGTYGGGPRFVDVKLLSKGGKTYAAALDAYFGLRLYALPELQEVGNFACNGGDYTGIACDQGQVYVGNNWGGLYRVDSAAASRVPFAEPNPGCTGPLAQAGRIYLQGNVDRTLHILDSSTGKRLGKLPLLEGSRMGDTRRFGATFPALQGNLLYLPGFARVVDVSDPSKPQVVGECQEAGFQNDGVCLAPLHGRLYAVLNGAEALKVVDVTTPHKPTLVGSLAGDFLGGYYFGRGMQVQGNLVYVCNRAQLNVVDLSQPRSPRLLSSVELTGNPCDLVVADGLAYVASYYGGLNVVDVGQPEHPRRLAHFQQGNYRDSDAWDNQTAYQSLGYDGKRLYVTDYYSGLQIWSR